MKILTTYVYPPVPIRCFDWQACVEGEEENVFFGATEQEAINNLKEELNIKD